MSHQCKFIAIEGPDGSGKSTQIALLTQHFENQGIKTRYVHFPRSNEGVYGALISKFLRGEFGDSKSVHPQLVALLFAQDRKEFAPVLQSWLNEGSVVIVDRYVLSNIAFQCAKLHTHNEKQELTHWINSFEYEYNQIPKPDLSLYLDVPFSFSQKLLNEARKGDERNYLEGKEDIHEKDTSLQIAVKQEYERLLQIDNSIVKVICFDATSNMKSVNDIHTEIVSLIDAVS